MRIRSKISLLTGVVFLGALCITGLSLWTMREIARLQDTIDSGSRLIASASRLHGLMKDLMFDLFTPQTYRLLKDVLHTPRFQTTRADFQAAVMDFQTATSVFMESPRVKALLREPELRDAYETAQTMTAKAFRRIRAFESGVDRLFLASISGGDNLYRQLQAEGNPSIPAFFDEVRETSYYLTYSFESFLSHFLQSLRRESNVIRRQILLIFWSLTALIGVATLSLSAVFARRISGRIKIVEEGFRRVSHGDFTARLDVRTSDELGTLAANFNHFLSDLKKNVDSIQHLMRDVGQSLTNQPNLARILALIVETVVKDSRAGGAAIITARPGKAGRTVGASAPAVAAPAVSPPSDEEASDGEAACRRDAAAGRHRPPAARTSTWLVARTAGTFPFARGEEIPDGKVPSSDTIPLRRICNRRETVFVREPLELRPGCRVGSFLALPLAVSKGMVGMLCIVTGEGEPSLTDLDQTNFHTFAWHAGLIIDNYYQYRELLARREAEYRALQSQIQPHFLYNVLNVFIGLNRLGESRTLERAILSLKDMLRYILESGDWSTLEEEFRFLERYCEQQRLRFGDRLTASFHLDRRVEHFRVPKLILQPLVENAVIRGIEPLDRPGTLSVEARLRRRIGASVVDIRVRDDGIGLPPDRHGAEPGIGLANVRERLRIAFPSSRFAIESSPGTGTCASIEIVQEEGGKE